MLAYESVDSLHITVKIIVELVKPDDSHSFCLYQVAKNLLLLIQDSELTFDPEPDVINTGHRLRRMIAGISGCQLQSKQKECQYCTQISYHECLVCQIVVCQECFDDHVRESPRKRKHNIISIGYYTTSSGRIRQRRKECGHCSTKGENRKRRQTSMECITCDYGVCVDCQSLHLALEPSMQELSSYVLCKCLQDPCCCAFVHKLE